MIKKLMLAFGIISAVLGVNSCSDTESPVVKLSFTGPDPGKYKKVYVAWIEDENGKNLQNLWVCKSLISTRHPLTGTALPYWKTEKYTRNPDVDGVTEASEMVQQKNIISRKLKIGDARTFRVCLEIDKSLNENAHFNDRPSYIYKSPLIDLDNPEPQYDLVLDGWMANDTLSGTWSQAPKNPVPDFKAYSYRQDLKYIAPADDLVTSLSAIIIQE